MSELVFHSDGVSLRKVGSQLVDTLCRDAQPDRLLRSIFRVMIVQRDRPDDDSVPDICGRYEIGNDVVRFVPLFPFEPGIPYRAVFDPRGIDCVGPSAVLALEFSLPREQGAVAAEVTRIFPSSDLLPENLLRLYVCFSAPMQRGRSQEQITILGPDGRPAPDVLYRAPVELWDRSMKYLTVLLDPGRLKRGVGPNVELGPPLVAGREYTLAVGSGMVDSSGRPLRAPFSKRFRVTDAVRDPIAVDRWKVVSPLAGSLGPVVVTFPRPLDWALLLRAITIRSSDRRLVDGRATIEHGETQWSFKPASPWRAGSYEIRVASSLEDVCGNSTAAAFDRALRPPGTFSDNVVERSVPFQTWQSHFQDCRLPGESTPG